MQKVQVVEDDELLNSSETMELARISRRTLERWVATGKLAFQKLPGNGERRYRRADVLFLVTPSAPVEPIVQSSSAARTVTGAQSSADRELEETAGGRRPAGLPGEVREPLAADSTRTSPAIDHGDAR